MFSPSEIGSIPRPKRSQLIKEGDVKLPKFPGSGHPNFEKGDKNPAWRGGITSDMKLYRKTWRKKNAGYQTEYHKRRRENFIAMGLRYDGKPRKTST